ncbi:hypothetical protein EON65_38365 [archaeon]|nr:MAG: hypothetical protein EON65_38365 [archaeon]
MQDGGDMEQDAMEEDTPTEPAFSAINETDVKIKKKPRVMEDSPDEDDSEPVKLATEHLDDAGKAMKEQEIKARQHLTDFLTKHNIDPKLADDYQVHVRKSKAKNRNTEHGSPGGVTYTYAVTYIGTDGSILASKSDVLSAIQDRIRRRQSTSSRPSLGTRNFCTRDEAYEKAKHRLDEKLNSAEETFPMKITDTIEVHSLGNIDLREGFHSGVQLYPVGYRCKKVITGLSFYKGFPSQTIVCEIVESDGFPEFRIVIPGTGTTHWATSEFMAWKKVGFFLFFVMRSCLVDACVNVLSMGMNMDMGMGMGKGMRICMGIWVCV